MSDYLFVYGTLKRGYCRHFALRQAEFLGIVHTQAAFQLWDCGEYPALVRSPDGCSITGELYRISPSLYGLLDELEGVPEQLYRREQIALLPPHQELPVTAYLYNRPVVGLRNCGHSWPSSNSSKDQQE